MVKRYCVLFNLTVKQRPATARLIDVGSTHTWAAGLNNRQRSSGVMSASSNVSVEQMSVEPNTAATGLNIRQKTSCVKPASSNGATDQMRVQPSLVRLVRTNGRVQAV